MEHKYENDVIFFRLQSISFDRQIDYEKCDSYELINKKSKKEIKGFSEYCAQEHLMTLQPQEIGARKRDGIKIDEETRNKILEKTIKQIEDELKDENKQI